MSIRRVQGTGLAAALIILTGQAHAGAPDSAIKTSAAGVPVRVIRVNLADPRVSVTPMVCRNSRGHSESFRSMIARARPTIAIVGAFFDTRTWRPIGDIVIGGRLIHRGMLRTALAISWNNRAVIRRGPRGRSPDWSRYRSVIACGPALVLHGQVDVHPREEGFHDPHIMRSTRRMGVGLTADRHMLLVMTLTPVTFSRWARVMCALGCVDAMNLDAGASMAMYYRGRTIIRPGRRLTNLLLVYVHPARPQRGYRAGARVASLRSRRRRGLAQRQEKNARRLWRDSRLMPLARAGTPYPNRNSVGVRASKWDARRGGPVLPGRKHTALTARRHHSDRVRRQLPASRPHRRARSGPATILHTV